MILLLVFAVSVLAGAIQNIAGFGAGIIIMLVFPRFYGIVGAASLNQAICTWMTILVAWRYRAWLNTKLVLTPMVCYLIASLSTLSIVGDIDLTYLSILFGFFLLALSIYFLFIQKNLKIEPTPQAAAICGFISGILSGLFALGAPAAALYFLSVTNKRESYMGNLQALFASTNLVNLCMRVARGYFTTDMIPSAAVGFFALLLGQWIGSKIAGRLSAGKINHIIYLLVGFSGVVTLAKQFLKIIL